MSTQRKMFVEHIDLIETRAAEKSLYVALSADVIHGKSDRKIENIFLSPETFPTPS